MSFCSFGLPDWTRALSNQHVDKLLLVIRAMPGLIRVVVLHCRSELGGIRSQVLLVNGAVVADDKSLHSGDSIFCRARKPREAAARHAIHQIVDLCY